MFLNIKIKILIVCSPPEENKHEQQNYLMSKTYGVNFKCCESIVVASASMSVCVCACIPVCVCVDMHSPWV